MAATANGHVNVPDWVTSPDDQGKTKSESKSEGKSKSDSKEKVFLKLKKQGKSPLVIQFTCM